LIQLAALAGDDGRRNNNSVAPALLQQAIQS